MKPYIGTQIAFTDRSGQPKQGRIVGHEPSVNRRGWPTEGRLLFVQVEGEDFWAEIHERHITTERTT